LTLCIIGPLLLGCAEFDGKGEGEVKAKSSDIPDWKSLPKHHDEDQVRLDVDRSFIYYPIGKPQLSRHNSQWN
jgi:hypothetical protein